MKFNTKVRYGMRVILEIAKADQSTGILQKDISKNQFISLKYLDHIIRSLKTGGLISNVKGKRSGYHLTRKSSEITTLDIYKAFESEITVIECMSQYFDCKLEPVCYTNSFWRGLNDIIADYFSSITLNELIQRKELTQ